MVEVEPEIWVPVPQTVCGESKFYQHYIGFQWAKLFWSQSPKLLDRWFPTKEEFLTKEGVLGRNFHFIV